MGLCDILPSFEDRNQALQDLLAELMADRIVDYLHGELYPVTPGDQAQALMLIDRACAPYFGVRTFGQHVNGFVRDGERLHMWVARRAANRRTYPGYLDHLAAGGLPWGLMTLADNLRKECREEANIPVALADRARPVSLVTYCRDSERGLKPDVIYCYDLELPPDFEPRGADGEVESFSLWPVERVMETVRESDEFKLNCNLVIIDFLGRHGYISPDSQDYLPVVQGLRAPCPEAGTVPARGRKQIPGRVVVNLVVIGGNRVIVQTSPSFRQGVPESRGQEWPVAGTQPIYHFEIYHYLRSVVINT